MEDKTNPEECKLDKLNFPITDYCAKHNVSETEFKKV